MAASAWRSVRGGGSIISGAACALAYLTYAKESRRRGEMALGGAGVIMA